MLPMPSGTTHTLFLSTFINFWFIGKFIFYLYHCVSLKLFDRALNVKISVSISNKESSFNSSTKFTFLSHAVINLLAPLRSTLDKRVWTNPSCGSWGFLSQRTNPNDAVDIHNIQLWWSITSIGTHVHQTYTIHIHNLWRVFQAKGFDQGVALTPPWFRLAPPSLLKMNLFISVPFVSPRLLCLCNLPWLLTFIVEFSFSALVFFL